MTFLELQLSFPLTLNDLLVTVQCIFRDLLRYLWRKQRLNLEVYMVYGLDQLWGDQPVIGAQPGA